MRNIIVTLIFMAMLTGCGSLSSRSYNPPPRNKSVTKVPESSENKNNNDHSLSTKKSSKPPTKKRSKSNISNDDNWIGPTTDTSILRDISRGTSGSQPLNCSIDSDNAACRNRSRELFEKIMKR